MKKTLLAFVILAVISAAVLMIKPETVISIQTGAETETVISWNIRGAVSETDQAPYIVTTRRHISIERYIDGDINDAVIIWHDVRHWTGSAFYPDGNTWTVGGVNAWHDTDAAFLNIEISL